MFEVNFDGLVGPTHNYAGLARGNLASMRHGGWRSNPKQAALQGLAKMRWLMQLGVPQAVLPPQPRPDLATLRALGFGGSDEQVLSTAAKNAPRLLAMCSSASAMWTANAATVVPGCDALDGRTHLVPANLASMFHRQLEVATTTRVLRAIFADEARFCVHSPLPGHVEFGDEGAANHTRLHTDEAAAGDGQLQRALHLFAWGRNDETAAQHTVHPARQTLAASQAVARLCELPTQQTVFWPQHPAGIAAGAFHTDVLAVGHGSFLMLHEAAFADHELLLKQLQSMLGEAFSWVVATEEELPLAQAVSSYPFNSQIVSPDAMQMVIIAPSEAQQNPYASAFLQRVVESNNPVCRVDYIDVRQSMSNGGGPACLRLRVPLQDDDRQALRANVLLTDELHQRLISWVEQHYRDQLTADDLSDPQLLREVHAALDELSQLLELGSVFDFQRC